MHLTPVDDVSVAIATVVAILHLPVRLPGCGIRRKELYSKGNICFKFDVKEVMFSPFVTFDRDK